MKIVFMGTPEFAVPSLKAMVENFNVEGVFTQPDRPKGRGKKLAMSPVKEVALENNIDVYQPVSLRKEPEFIEKLKNIQPEDRKSTRLNSSHANISYAVFCLKKKKYLGHNLSYLIILLHLCF